jgi:alpha-1,2-mannosyltransferase
MTAPDDTLSAVTPISEPIAPARRGRRRWVGRIAIGLLLLFAMGDIWLRRGSWGFEDVRAYWEAALRVREGLPLYGGPDDPNSYGVFRYAPWFAWMWVPLTYLPRQAAELLWGAVLAASALGVLWALVRLRTAASVSLAVLFLPMFMSLVQVGNVQPLLVAILAFGISRRSGPLWIAVAASIKATPILYGLIYVARREWGRLAIAIAITALLLAPLLLADTSGYETDPGASFSLYYYASPLAWAVAAGASVLLAAWLAWRRSDWVWVAASVAVALCAPRAHVTYATFLAVGLLDQARDRIGRRTLDAATRAAVPRDSSVEE